MTYLANNDFDYAINHKVQHFTKDQEVIVPDSEVEYMVEQGFIREKTKSNETETESNETETEETESNETETEETESNEAEKEELRVAIANIEEKIANESNPTKLEKLEKKKQKFLEDLTNLEK